MSKTRMMPLVIAAIAAMPASGLAQNFKVDKWNIGGEGGHDYITAEAGTGRVFVSRGTHVMVVDGKTGKVLGDVEKTPRVHGTAIAPKLKRGFTSNAGDSTVTVFDIDTFLEVQRIKIDVGGLDGIMFDEASGHVVLTNHSNPGTAVWFDADNGEVDGTASLEDKAPEGAVSDGNGRLFVNLEGKNAIQVLSIESAKSLAVWPIEACDGPTGIAFDKKSNRIFAGCSKTSVVVDAKTGKVVATLANGDGVDALAWDAAEKLLYIPGGQSGDVTVYRQDAPDKYTKVATVPTMKGAKTITIDPVTHRAYAVALERGPAPAAPANQPAGARPPMGPVVGAWFMAISH